MKLPHAFSTTPTIHNQIADMLCAKDFHLKNAFAQS